MGPWDEISLICSLLLSLLIYSMQNGRGRRPFALLVLSMLIPGPVVRASE
jgi:hypothetical protein